MFGNVKKGIKIRVIGGEGNDVIKDFSTVKGLRKYTKVYDETTGTQLLSSKETKNHTSDTDKEINHYERFKFYPNIAPPIIKMGYNIDDGLFLGGGVLFKKHGWRKAPYAYTQKLVTTISPSTSAFQFLYEGDFYQISKKWNLHLMSEIKAPNSTTNYFGMGNKSLPLNSDISFYRLKYDHIELSTLIGKNLDKNQTFKIGIKYDYVKINDDSLRFTNSQGAGLNESDFERTHLVGAKFIYEINTLNHKVLPSKGVKFKLVSDWIYNSTKNSSISKLKFDFQFAKQFKFPFNPTIAVRAGGATIFDDFSFYQANTLGAQNKSMGRGNLRGFQRDRFSGRILAYQNADLRLDLFKFESYLFPGQFGVLGFIDNGRVWIDNEISNRWHQSYGGGVWLGILKTWVLVATYEKSNEGELINFNASFFF